MPVVLGNRTRRGYSPPMRLVSRPCPPRIIAFAVGLRMRKHKADLNGKDSGQLSLLALLALNLLPVAPAQ